MVQESLSNLNTSQACRYLGGRHSQSDLEPLGDDGLDEIISDPDIVGVVVALAVQFQLHCHYLNLCESVDALWVLDIPSHAHVSVDSMLEALLRSAPM
ncbi:hypothetical protein L1987_53105 [Smallanthus sonchifolius]|uniref:Uncharacterized protein n=1 Tax=Smallanthus sonchifolius TaxID=185202 RepID=A0ACB9EVK6_9ASTR|nr:hypothetical protein L1987_53105 [Smallanthus sonchifolius]